MFAEGDRELGLYLMAVISFFTNIPTRSSGDNEVLLYPVRLTCEFTCKQSVYGLVSCVSMKYSGELFLLMMPLQFHCHIISCHLVGCPCFQWGGFYGSSCSSSFIDSFDSESDVIKLAFSIVYFLCLGLVGEYDFLLFSFCIFSGLDYWLCLYYVYAIMFGFLHLVVRGRGLYQEGHLSAQVVPGVGVSVMMLDLARILCCVCFQGVTVFLGSSYFLT